jgi:hypothetical protein
LLNHYSLLSRQAGLFWLAVRRVRESKTDRRKSAIPLVFEGPLSEYLFEYRHSSARLAQ